MATDYCRELAHDDGGTPILFHGSPSDYLLTHVQECDYATRPVHIIAPPPIEARDKRENRDLQDIMVLLERYFEAQGGRNR